MIRTSLWDELRNLQNHLPKIKTQEQINEIKQKLEEEPYSIRLLCQLTEWYNIKDQYQKALGYCDKILKLDDNNKLAYNNIFYAYDMLEDFDNALKVLNIYLTKFPLVKEPRFEGHSHSILTERYYKKKISNFPYYTIYLPFKKPSQVIDNNFSTAFSFSKIGWSERAFEVLNLILEHYPQDIYTMNGLAYNYIKKERYKEAKEAIDKALSINNEDFNSLLISGGLYRRTGKYKESKAIYNRLIQNSNSVDLPLNSSFDIKVYVNKENLKDVLNLYGAYHGLGLLCNETGEYEQAIELFTKVLNFRKRLSGFLTPKNSTLTPLYHKLGIAYHALDYNKLALKAFKKGLSCDPMSIEVLASLGELYFVMKKYKHAIETFRHIVNIEPENHLAWHLLSKSYFESGKKQYALETNTKCLSLDPKFDPALKLREILT